MAHIDKQIQVGSPFKVFYPSSDYPTYDGGLRKATLNVWIYTGTQGDTNDIAGGLNVDASLAGASGDRINTPSKSLISTAVGSIDEEFVSFDIANIVKSQLKQEFAGEGVSSTSTINPNTMVWVDYQLITKQNNSETIHPLFNCAGFDGYTYFEEGLNAQLSDGALMSSDVISSIEGEEVFIPVSIHCLTSVIFYSAEGSVMAQYNYTGLGSSVTDESYEQIAYPSATDASYVDIVNCVGGTRRITMNVLECNKHTPYRVSFLNRFGAIQSMWFNGNNTESVSNKSREYARVTTSSTNGSEYNTNRGSRYKQRASSSRSMILNSGFYPESANVTFEELIDSTEVWIEKDGSILPINIKATSFNKKTELNDNAINYTINVEYAFNKINNI